MKTDTEKINEKLAPVYAGIERLFETNGRVVVAFDGMSASGKTTAGELAAKRLGANLIHMDDFFLPLELRTPERLAEPGGNVHYERFLSEVVSGIRSGEPYAYRVFDCGAMDYAKTVEAEPKRLTIVEGAYSTHPRFGDFYDLKVFFSVEAETQRRRILERNGEEALAMFTGRWIPMENAYIAEYGVKDGCDIAVEL